MYLARLLFILYCAINHCVSQQGPDPWDHLPMNIQQSDNIPPDLRIQNKKLPSTQSDVGVAEWFFKRMLSIVLMGGQVTKNEDGSTEISLQMRLEENHWNTLQEYVRSTKALSEDKLRLSVGYIEESIYRPSFVEKIAMAWSDYIHAYLVEYKIHITWTLAILGVSGSIVWLWQRMSHRHLIIIILLIFYLYEVFVSYKEAEKQEVDKFMSALEKCKWQFWKSNCEVPPPDLLAFLKHMNPLKICVRMFATMITEPMISISDTVKTIVSGITDGLWFPFDVIVYSVLIVIFNTLLILLLVMIFSNFVLNIPMQLGFGFFNLNFKQRIRTFIPENNKNNGTRSQANIEGAGINTDTFNKMLDLCTRALDTAHQGRQLEVTHVSRSSNQNAIRNGMRRSASTGRLSNFVDSPFSDEIRVVRKRTIRGADGSGDAH